MDANSGEMAIWDLKNELDRGRTLTQTASFLCRDEREDEGAWVDRVAL